MTALGSFRSDRRFERIRGRDKTQWQAGGVRSDNGRTSRGPRRLRTHRQGREKQHPDRFDLRESDPVRPRRGSRPVPANARSGPRTVPSMGCRRCVHPGAGTHVSTGPPRSGLGDGRKSYGIHVRQDPPRSLSRRSDRGGETAQSGAAGCCRIRPEGRTTGAGDSRNGDATGDARRTETGRHRA